MEDKYRRIWNIRERIQNEFFTRIENTFKERWLNLSKEAFESVATEQRYNGANSYCNYVSFLRFYLEVDTKWR